MGGSGTSDCGMGVDCFYWYPSPFSSLDTISCHDRIPTLLLFLASDLDGRFQC